MLILGTLVIVAIAISLYKGGLSTDFYGDCEGRAAFGERVAAAAVGIFIGRICSGRDSQRACR